MKRAPKKLKRSDSAELTTACTAFRRSMKLLQTGQPQAVEEAIEALVAKHLLNVDAAQQDKSSAEYKIIKTSGIPVQSRDKEQQKLISAACKSANTVYDPATEALPDEMKRCQYGGTTMRGYCNYLSKNTNAVLESADTKLCNAVQMRVLNVCKTSQDPSSITGILSNMSLNKKPPEKHHRLLKASKYILLTNLWNNKDPAEIMLAYSSIGSTILDDPNDKYLVYSGKVYAGQAGDEGPPAADKKYQKEFMEKVEEKKAMLAKAARGMDEQKLLFRVATGEQGATLTDDITVPHGVANIDYIMQAIMGNFAPTWEIGKVVDDYEVACERLVVLSNLENKPFLALAVQVAMPLIEKTIAFAKGEFPTKPRPQGWPKGCRTQTLCTRFMTAVESIRKGGRSLLLQKVATACATTKEARTAIEPEVDRVLKGFDAVPSQMMVEELGKDQQRFKVASSALQYCSDPERYRQALKCTLLIKAKAVKSDDFVLLLMKTLWTMVTKDNLKKLEEKEAARDLAGFGEVAKEVAKDTFLNSEAMLQIMNREAVLKQQLKEDQVEDLAALMDDVDDL